MSFVKAIFELVYDLLIGDYWPLSAAGATVLAVAIVLAHLGGVSHAALALCVGVALMVAASVTIVGGARNTLRKERKAA